MNLSLNEITLLPRDRQACPSPILGLGCLR